MKNLAWHTKLVLALIAFLPIYFMIAALGTKIGLWSWIVGLVSMTFGAGPFLLGITALVALVSLIIGLIIKPRSKVVIAVAVVGLVIPAIMFGKC